MPLLKGLACAAILLAAPCDAHAYCRTTTSSMLPLGCDQPCVMEGIPLYWEAPCIGFSLNERGSETIPFDRVAAIADAAFARWTTEITCPGGPIEVSVIRDPGLVSCDRDHFSLRTGNVNVFAFLPDWTARDYDASAFALTQVKFRMSTGEILDADLLVNEESWTFAECPVTECTDGSVDLENTVVHEAGHFLGLAHTPDDTTAVMYACATVGETSKRFLMADDVAGICAIFDGRDYGGAVCDPTPVNGLDGTCPDAPPGCGCSTPGRSTPHAAVLVVLGLLLVRRSPRLTRRAKLRG